jgi:hypothetical protein
MEKSNSLVEHGGASYLIGVLLWSMSVRPLHLCHPHHLSHSLTLRSMDLRLMWLGCQ